MTNSNVVEWLHDQASLERAMRGEEFVPVGQKNPTLGWDGRVRIMRSEEDMASPHSSGYEGDEEDEV